MGGRSQDAHGDRRTPGMETYGTDVLANQLLRSFTEFAVDYMAMDAQLGVESGEEPIHSPLTISPTKSWPCIRPYFRLGQNQVCGIAVALGYL